MQKLIFSLFLISFFSSCIEDSNIHLVEPVFFPCYDELGGDPINPAKYSGIPEDCRTSLIDEDFSDNSAGWLEDNNNSRSYEVSQGVYKIVSKENVNWYYSREFSFLENVTNFEIEVDLTFVIGDISSTSSLTWGGYGGLENLFRFGVSREGYFEINRRISDSPSIDDLVTYTYSEYINTNSSNLLTIRMVSGTHYFFINKQLVAEIDNIILPGTEVGFNVAPNSEIHLDFFKISKFNI